MNLQLLLAQHGSPPDISIGAVVFFLLIYFIPVFIVWIRGHERKVAITILTVLLGWTIIGWVIALNWSLTFDVQGEE